MDIKPYLELMIKHKASDLFFAPGTQVKIKIEGVIRSVGETVLTADACHQAIEGIMTPEQIEELRRERELDFAIALEGRARFRVNAYFQRGHPAMVLRYIRSEVPTLEELKAPPILSELIMHKRGIILMVGATGSGKSTTLAAMIDHRNRHSTGHIVTIEDPIEFTHRHRQGIL
jgi:Tfp pilus assembly protein, ATPase PilU